MSKSKYLSMFLLYTTVAVTTATCLHQVSTINPFSPAPSPSPFTHSPPPPPSPPLSSSENMQQQQLKNIIDALIGAGDFAEWANILFNPVSNSSSIPSTIPTTATMFVPGNNALSGTATGAYTFDPFIIPYHILPQRLTFSDLQLFKPQTRIPTLLPSKTIVITDNAPAHFTIDDSLIIQPDLYTNAAVCVHGVDNVLDYKVYGEPDHTPPTFVPPPPLPPLPPADDQIDPPPPPVVTASMSLVCNCVCFLVHFLAIVILLLLY